MTTRHSERSDPRLKARFPRLQFLRKKREEDAWYATADDEGMVSIRPRR